MARNVEIKARLTDVEATAARAAALADRGPIEIVQDDTFFGCARGRLKLRAFPSGEGELIFYERPDEQGPKTSFFLLAPIAACEPLREVLTRAHGEAGRVRKRRTLYLVGRTRVHLDRVEHLGDFLELEVVLADDEAVEPGVEEARTLMQALGIEPRDLVEGAYVDLLARRHG